MNIDFWWNISWHYLPDSSDIQQLQKVKDIFEQRFWIVLDYPFINYEP